MSTNTCIDKLSSLIEYLDQLTERATIEELDKRISALDVTLDDVIEYARFGDKNYLRNLVCEGSWYHLLVNCWRSGQRSPIHNHSQSTCGFRVLTGVATETRFESSPSQLIKAVSSHDMHKGERAVTQDSEIHQVSNLQLSGTDLVTLHIYSPPLLRMDTYSLTEKSIGEFKPMIFESAGSGI